MRDTDDDIFTVVKGLADGMKKVATVLIVVEVPIVAIVALNGLDAVPKAALMGLIAVMTGVTAFAVLHLVAAASIVKLERWAMQMSMTIFIAWMAIGILPVLLCMYRPYFAVAGIPGVVIASLGWVGVRRSRLAMKRLDEDDGFSTDEPSRPKGFEPVVPMAVVSERPPSSDPSRRAPGADR